MDPKTSLERRWNVAGTPKTSLERRWNVAGRKILILGAPSVFLGEISDCGRSVRFFGEIWRFWGPHRIQRGFWSRCLGLGSFSFWLAEFGGFCARILFLWVSGRFLPVSVAFNFFFGDIDGNSAGFVFFIDHLLWPGRTGAHRLFLGTFGQKWI